MISKPNNSATDLVELSSHIKVVDGWWLAVNTVKANERIDFEIGKVEVGIDRVQSNQKIDERILLLGRDMRQKSTLDNITRRELLSDRERELESLGIDVTDLDTTFMCEEDIVSFTC